MTSPATNFLSAFNAIEGHLRDILKARNSDGFTWMVRLAAKKNMITEDQSRTLQEYAELRNAIVHGEFHNGQVIADPRPETVATIEALRDAIVAPPTAMDVLGPLPVKTLSPDDSITSALKMIAKSTISQFPVYRGGRFEGLLTTNTIARWVANDLDDNGHLDAVTVADAMKFAEHAERVEFLPRDITAARAVSTLMQPGSAQFALITASGRPHEKPLRAIGRSDLALLHQALFGQA